MHKIVLVVNEGGEILLDCCLKIGIMYDDISQMSFIKEKVVRS